MQPRQIIKNWPLIAGTVGIVSALWGFFFTKALEIKDQQIALLKQQYETSGLGPYVKSIDERLARLSLATAIDPIDGRVTIGSGMSSPTQITTLLIDIEQLEKDRKFDLIEGKLAQIEKLYPNFPGSIAIRFDVCVQKGQVNEAVECAEKLISIIPQDKRLLPVYSFLIDNDLKVGKKAEAETLALTELSLDPENKPFANLFEKIFGYKPSITQSK